MFVIGKTQLKEVYLASQKEGFRINEYLIINDEYHGNVLVEVVDSFTLPKAVDGVLPNGSTVELVEEVFKENKRIYIAKVNVLNVLTSPITPNSECRKADFSEVEDLLLQAQPDKGFTLGVIKGTENMQDELPTHLQNISPFWVNKRADKQKGVPFIINHRDQRVYPHIGIFGTSGSGKSFGMRVICEEMMKKRIPALAFDPHLELNFNKTMDGLASEHVYDYSDSHKIFKVGKDIGISFADLKFDELVHLLEFVDPLSEPQKSALESLYKKGDTLAHLKGQISKLKTAFEYNDLKQSERKDKSISPEETLLYERFKHEVSGAKALQALNWKIISLEKTNIFEGNVLGAERALKEGKLAIIRGDMQRLLMLSSYILKKFYKKRRNFQDASEQSGVENAEYFPMFFTIFDEAHNFAPKGHATPTRRIIKTIAQEARKYGVFEVFCTQKPDALDETIMAQLNTKIVYRLNTTSDMEMIQKETNLTPEEVKTLPDLPSGHCFVFSPTLPKTFAVQFRTTFTASPHSVDPFEEFVGYLKETAKDDVDDALLSILPIETGKMARIQSQLSDILGKSVDIETITKSLEKMEKEGRILAKKNPFGKSYTNI